MNSEGLFQGKVAIVTGGSSGIGQATCIALANMQFQIVVVGTNPQGIDRTLNYLNQFPSNRPHQGLALNVAHEADMQIMTEKTLEQFGRIDLLVASAGLGKKSGSERIIPPSAALLSLDEWNEILNVNLTGVFLSNRAVLPTMISQGSGQIINIGSATSIHGLRGQPYASAYCASKFGVVGFSESLAEEVSTYGIRVQALLPGLVTTSLVPVKAFSRSWGGSISVESIADAIVGLVKQPIDAVTVDPCLLPFRDSKLMT
jgi:NAD(P)-dependent dehydrogenase (short-subunit alcohol dehydrogenase family)